MAVESKVGGMEKKVEPPKPAAGPPAPPRLVEPDAAEERTEARPRRPRAFRAAGGNRPKMQFAADELLIWKIKVAALSLGIPPGQLVEKTMRERVKTFDFPVIPERVVAARKRRESAQEVAA